MTGHILDQTSKLLVRYHKADVAVPRHQALVGAVLDDLFLV